VLHRLCDYPAAWIEDVIEEGREMGGDIGLGFVETAGTQISGLFGSIR
jgi:hypothetical protein